MLTERRSYIFMSIKENEVKGIYCLKSNLENLGKNLIDNYNESSKILELFDRLGASVLRIEPDIEKIKILRKENPLQCSIQECIEYEEDDEGEGTADYIFLFEEDNKWYVSKRDTEIGRFSEFYLLSTVLNRLDVLNKIVDFLKNEEILSFKVTDDKNQPGVIFSKGGKSIFIRMYLESEIKMHLESEKGEKETEEIESFEEFLEIYRGM